MPRSRGDRRAPSRRRLRRGGDHPARRRPLAARLAAQRPGRRDPDRARGRELGQPDEQGRAVRPARPHVRLERDPAAGGRRAARARRRTGSRRSVPTPSTTGSSGSRAPSARTSAAGRDSIRGPFLLYVCSSGFIAADERPIVASLGRGAPRRPRARRASACSSGRTRRTARSGPSTPLGAFPNVAVWPRVGEDPTDEERRSGFYDSIYHSAAVVGANTTALIDAAIVGRRTFSILLPELTGAQEQTLHFHYLLPENGGALIVARLARGAPRPAARACSAASRPTRAGGRSS